ncbi:hypothetical protein [Janibacter sp. LM]|uniref:hypothetical protein n=1 Tax=Janibacter sp. LM TaxID=3144845 RepID=UPI0031F5FA42
MSRVPKLMTVTILDRSSWGSPAPYPRVVTVEISTQCPQCGGPRGVPQSVRFHEDGQWLSCDRWHNPCEHVDMYDQLLREVKERECGAR